MCEQLFIGQLYSAAVDGMDAVELRDNQSHNWLKKVVQLMSHLERINHVVHSVLVDDISSGRTTCRALFPLLTSPPGLQTWLTKPMGTAVRLDCPVDDTVADSTLDFFNNRARDTLNPVRMDLVTPEAVIEVGLRRCDGFGTHCQVRLHFDSECVQVWLKHRFSDHFIQKIRQKQLADFSFSLCSVYSC